MHKSITFFVPDTKSLTFCFPSEIRNPTANHTTQFNSPQKTIHRMSKEVKDCFQFISQFCVVFRCSMNSRESARSNPKVRGNQWNESKEEIEKMKNYLSLCKFLYFHSPPTSRHYTLPFIQSGKIAQTNVHNKTRRWRKQPTNRKGLDWTCWAPTRGIVQGKGGRVSDDRHQNKRIYIVWDGPMFDVSNVCLKYTKLMLWSRVDVSFFLLVFCDSTATSRWMKD